MTDVRISLQIFRTNVMNAVKFSNERMTWSIMFRGNTGESGFLATFVTNLFHTRGMSLATLRIFTSD